MNFWKLVTAITLLFLFLIDVEQQATIHDLTDAVNALNLAFAEQHQVNQNVQQSLRMRPISLEPQR